MSNFPAIAMPSVVYRFGSFVLDPANELLRRNGTRIRLQSQPFKLLSLLLQSPGEIVPHQDIRHCLWPVYPPAQLDKSIGVAIVKLRAALADDAGNPRYIETVPRRGYRFLAPVSLELAERSSAVVARAPELPHVSIVAAQTLDESAARRRSWFALHRVFTLFAALFLAALST